MSKIEGSCKTKPKLNIPESSGGEIEYYIKTFTKINILKPSPFLINGKRVIL